MGIPVVAARPDRLRQFRVTAGGLAEGLALRRAGLADAVDRYRRATERRYEVDLDGALDAVEGLGIAVRELGEWVGRVGDAFDQLPGVRGINLARLPALLEVLPPHLRVVPGGRGAAVTGSGVDVGAIGLTMASFAARGADLRDLDAMASVLGRGSPAGRALAEVASSPRGQAIGRFVDEAQAIVTGAEEGWHRWESESGREGVERAGRAILDGVLTTVGGYGGAAAGAQLAASVCASSVVAVPICASVGARGGGALGAAAAEAVSDWLLGDEPEPWQRDPATLAEEVGDVDDDITTLTGDALGDAEVEATEQARRHADFIVGHPWRWDDEYADAPWHASPPPPPDLPATGFR